MRLGVILFLSLSPAAMGAAATLEGVFYRDRVGGAGVAGVAVTAKGAAPARSTQSGGFTLLFPEKKPGDAVLVVVTPPNGLVVVNAIQLEVVLAGDADARVLKVILSTEKDRVDRAIEFYQLRGREAIEASYQRGVKEGQSVARLRAERDQARAAVERLAGELAKVKPVDTPALYAQAMRLYLDGKVREAIEALDEAKLREMSAAVEARVSELARSWRLRGQLREMSAAAEARVSELTRSWRLRGQLLTTQFRFAEAETAYAAAVRLSPGDFEACFDQAYFLQGLNRHAMATKGYGRCLTLARESGDPGRIAGMLNNLGVLHSDQNRKEEARKAYEEALAIRRKLAAANPDTYLPDVARVLWGMGRMHAAMDQAAGARRAFGEALEIFEKFAERDREQYQPFVNLVKADLEKVKP